MRKVGEGLQILGGGERMKQKEEKEAQITVQRNKGVIKKKKGAGQNR